MAEHGDPPALGVAVDMPARTGAGVTTGAMVTTGGPGGEAPRGGSVVIDAGVVPARRGLWLAVAVVVAVAIGGGWYIWERPLAVRMGVVTGPRTLRAITATAFMTMSPVAWP